MTPKEKELVEVLRHACGRCLSNETCSCEEQYQLIQRMDAEIGRLTEEVAAQKGVVEDVAAENEKLHAEIERLRAAVEYWKKVAIRGGPGLTPAEQGAVHEQVTSEEVNRPDSANPGGVMTLESVRNYEK